MATFISNSPEETLDFGRRWAERLAPGTVIGLTGDLGSGKTQLVKGIAAGLGITTTIPSPTFALVIEHAGGRLPLAHLDFYRMQSDEDIIRAGLEAYFQPAGVSVIEWFDRWRGPLPDHFRRFKITTLGETERRIDYEDAGH
ncbi:MAG: tRNA (adenosine(37)-N6)-threonylcarbamoyltransferase complex ATPase subunit type 1 TsaE [Pedosphaera sp.]|nr:tRNA (adenosine(37)-N6)-threonylcarbamoyltransferase complex ATPase subunit type 1 TsaE [Pedosphaera sp.]